MDNCIPKHVAIIMDGNGRWAKKRHLPRTAGHLQGTKHIRNIAIQANKMGIASLTLYAFSTENWNRPMEEVEFIMRLPGVFIADYLDELMENNVRVAMVGDMKRIPEYALRPIVEAMERTAPNTGLILNLAMNYGGRDELVRAMRQIAADGVAPEDIDEECIGSYLMTPYTDVDLLIRTSGEIRLSNFLLWQVAYSEMIFVDTYWPDFNEQCFADAIEEYQKRNRRFGGV